MKVKELGQYFTTNLELKDKVFDFILNNPNVILEPSIGRGDFVSHILTKLPKVKFDMFEIDTTIKLLDCLNKEKVIYGDFMKKVITKSYKTIIGNPPYVRTSKGNLYIDFTEKCYNLLSEKGELIFIVPSDFFKLTSSSILLNQMMKNGTFTHVYHPNNEKLFENASIDIVVFRYCKDASLDKKVIYNDKVLYIVNSNGLITFNEEHNDNKNLLSDYFDVYVGIVSGKDAVYKNENLGNIEVLNGEENISNYIYIEKFPCDNEEINAHLLKRKEELLSRKIKEFNENNWFEWGAPRNITTINGNMNRECIYVCNLTRKKNIAFLGKVMYFGGSLIMLIPKKKCDLISVVSYLNSEKFKRNFLFSGRFKIGHRQLCNTNLPL